MTCAVGFIENDGTLLMGADSALSGGSSLDLLGVDNSKVFRKKAGNEECLVAVAGNGGFLQVIEHRLVFPALPDSRENDAMMRWVTVDVLDVLRTVVKANGAMITKDGVDSTSGRFMLGVRSRLYEVGESLYVKAIADTFAAIGSGYQEALGVFFAIQKLKVECDAETAIRTALEAAERWNPNVRGPFRIIRS